MNVGYSKVTMIMKVDGHKLPSSMREKGGPYVVFTTPLTTTNHFKTYPYSFSKIPHN